MFEKRRRLKEAAALLEEAVRLRVLRKVTPHEIVMLYRYDNGEVDWIAVKVSEAVRDLAERADQYNTLERAVEKARARAEGGI